MIDELDATQQFPSELLSSLADKGKLGSSDIISAWLTVSFVKTKVFKGSSSEVNYNLQLVDLQKNKV